MLDPSLLSDRLQAIRILLLDVDGVMTDGGLFLGRNEEMKRFHSRDGSAIKYLQRSGIVVGVVTGRESDAVARRARELGLTEVHQKALKKWPVVESILERRGLVPEQAAFVGDDLVDLPVMIRVGLGVAVADATEDVRRNADAVTDAPGGCGAVREVAEAILRAQGHWEKILASYLERGEQSSPHQGAHATGRGPS